MEQERLLNVQQIYSTIEPQDQSVKEVQKHNFNQLLKLKKLTAIIKQQQLIPPQTDEPSQDIDTFMYNRIYTVPVSLNVNTVLFFNIAFNEVKKLRYFGKFLATLLSLNCICSNFLLWYTIIHWNYNYYVLNRI